MEIEVQKQLQSGREQLTEQIRKQELEKNLLKESEYQLKMKEMEEAAGRPEKSWPKKMRREKRNRDPCSFREKCRNWPWRKCSLLRSPSM